MSKLLAKIKGQTTHKPASETKPTRTNDRSEEQHTHEHNIKDTQSQAEAPKGTQPPLMSYESTNGSGACAARGGGKKSEEPVEEQRFFIQPHPARTNNPQDLNPGDEQDFMSPGRGACSARQPQAQPLAPNVFAMPGIAIPDAAQQQQIPPPSNSDELKARSAELNKPSVKETEGNQEL